MRESSSVEVQQVTKCWDMCHVSRTCPVGARGFYRGAYQSRFPVPRQHRCGSEYLIKKSGTGMGGSPCEQTQSPCPYGFITVSLRFHHPFQLAAQGVDPLAGLVDMTVDRLVAFNAIRDQLEGGLSAGFGQTCLDHHVQVGPVAPAGA